MAVATAPIAAEVWPHGSDAPLRWLRLGPHVAWLDSGVGDADRGRRSLVALELSPAAVVDAAGARVVDPRGATREVAPTYIWQAADAMLRAEVERAPRAGDVRPLGWIGVVAYEARHFADSAYASSRIGRASSPRVRRLPTRASVRHAGPPGWRRPRPHRWLSMRGRGPPPAHRIACGTAAPSATSATRSAAATCIRLA